MAVGSFFCETMIKIDNLNAFALLICVYNILKWEILHLVRVAVCSLVTCCVCGFGHIVYVYFSILVVKFVSITSNKSLNLNSIL